MLEIKQAGDKEIRKYVRMMIAANPASQPVQATVSAPNVLVVSSGSNLTTLALEGLRYVEIDNLQDLKALKVLLSKSDSEKEIGFKVDTLVFDTLSDLQSVLLRKKLDDEGLGEASYEQWNWINEKMERILEGFDELNMHIIYLTNVSNISDSPEIHPNLPGAFKNNIHKFLDYAFLLEKIEPHTELANPEVVDNKIEGDEIPASRTVLRTSPTRRHPWTQDYTAQLNSTIDLNFNDDFAKIVKSRENINVTNSGGTKVDEPSPQPVEAEAEVEVNQDVDVPPGYSTHDRISAILQGSK